MYLEFNGATANVIFNDLDLHFQGHEFWNVKISKTPRTSKKMLRYDFYRGWHLPSNKTIVYVVLDDLDQNFQGQTFQVAIFTCERCKMPTFQLPSDRKTGICRRMAPLRILNVMTLIYIFTVTNFEMWISRKRWERAKNAQVWRL